MTAARNSACNGDIINFDPIWCVTQYPDCLATELSPYEHYRRIGKLLSRYPTDPLLNSKTQEEGIIKVSVICITYNHEKFIKQALEGFLSQKVDFPIEFIVADDCSTDGTRTIIERYAGYDSRIVPIFNEKNIGVAANFLTAAAKVSGQYVAMCEGDDFWTDPNKMQRQADYLDLNKETSIIFHPVEIFFDDNSAPASIFPATQPDLTISSLAIENFIQTNSVMYRWRFQGGIPSWFDASVLPLDWYLHLCHAEIGKIAYLPDVMAKYRKHAGGIWAFHANNPEHLRRRHGSAQLRFFSSAMDIAGGIFRDFYQKEKGAHLNNLASDALGRSDSKLLITLSKEYEKELEKLGYLRDADAGLMINDDDSRLLDRWISSTKISVVVLTFNHIKYIRECLDSIVRQKGLFSLQIIIGDDCSDDGTSEIVDEFSRLHSNITVFRPQKNIGMLENMKNCLSLCSGDFIAFCEGDDYWVGDRKLARQLSVLRRDKKLSMCFNWVMLQIEDTGACIPHPQQGVLGNDVAISFVARNPVTANFSCCMYRAEAVNAIPDRYFQEKGNADWMFNMYVGEFGGFAFLREIHSVYRIQDKGLWSGLPKSEQERAFFESRKRCATEIGPCRGFDDYISISFVDFFPAAKERFAFNLDSPVNGSRSELESGAIRLEGWVLDKLGQEVTVSVRRRKNTIFENETYDLTERRPDVTQYIRSQLGFQSSLINGFNLSVKIYGISDEIELWFCAGEYAARAARVRVMLDNTLGR